MEKTGKGFNRNSMRLTSNLKVYAVSCVTAALLITFSGCGKKPSTGIPSDITIDQVLSVIDKRANLVHDLSGRAQVTVHNSGKDHDAVLLVNYKEPAYYRAIMKGAFGVVMAVITSNEDSMTVYVPSLKGYIVAGNNDNDIMKTLVPEVSFNFSRLTSIITGLILPEHYHDEARFSLERLTNSVILTMKTDTGSYRYTLAGAGLIVTFVEVTEKGDTTILIEYNDYELSGKTLFPRAITVSEKDRNVRIDFTSCAVNKGVADSGLVFPLPSNADKLTLKPRGVSR